MDGLILTRKNHRSSNKRGLKKCEFHSSFSREKFREVALHDLILKRVCAREARGGSIKRFWNVREALGGSTKKILNVREARGGSMKKISSACGVGNDYSSSFIIHH